MATMNQDRGMQVYLRIMIAILALSGVYHIWRTPEGIPAKIALFAVFGIGLCASTRLLPPAKVWLALFITCVYLGSRLTLALNHAPNMWQALDALGDGYTMLVYASCLTVPFSMSRVPSARAQSDDHVDK
jgi:hypothetical protein